MVKDKLLQTTEAQPAITELSLPNNLKRKRRDSEQTANLVEDRKPAGRMTGFMSHVEVTKASNGDEDTIRSELSSIPPKLVAEEQRQTGKEMEMDWEKTNEATEGRSSLPTSGTLGRRLRNGIECADAVVDSSFMTPLQQAIETEFSLEILLKHNELRLIDQELAKCQIALEQLRRCQIVPYPATLSTIEDLQAVSGGSGPALKLRSGADQPPHPAPWGVADGPYARHYAKWLLPDPAFDNSIHAEIRTPRAGGKKVPERSTRGSIAEKSTSASHIRSQRGSTTSRLQALPAGYPEPKEEKGPMIVKRSTDGKMVKLVCLDCRRDNFNSAQGFINHCRIAHSRGFASHDAAAIACGEEVELNEVGGLVGDQSLGNSANAGLVHPLIRSAHLTKNEPAAPLPLISSRKKTSEEVISTSYSPDSSSRNTARAGPGTVPRHGEGSADLPFTPSSETPHLSALFAKHGRGGNLMEMVDQAKTTLPAPTELSSDDEEGDHEMEDAPEPESYGHVGARGLLPGGRLPARATMSPAPLERPPSSKGIDKPSRKPEYLNNIIARNAYSSPYAASNDTSAAPSQEEDSNTTVLLDGSLPLNLSPNTIESNPAPSLVSDDGDYENALSESETPSIAADEEEDRYLDIEVEDEVVGEPSVDPELATAEKAHPTRKSSALRSPTAIRSGHEDRHVSFASPTRRDRRRKDSK